MRTVFICKFCSDLSFLSQTQVPYAPRMHHVVALRTEYSIIILYIYICVLHIRQPTIAPDSHVSAQCHLLCFIMGM